MWLRPDVTAAVPVYGAYPVADKTGRQNDFRQGLFDLEDLLSCPFSYAHLWLRLAPGCIKWASQRLCWANVQNTRVDTQKALSMWQFPMLLFHVWALSSPSARTYVYVCLPVPMCVYVKVSIPLSPSSRVPRPINWRRLKRRELVWKLEEGKS